MSFIRQYRRYLLLFLLFTVYLAAMTALFRQDAGPKALFSAGMFFGALFLTMNGYTLYSQSMKIRENKSLSATQEIFRVASEVASDGIFEWDFVRDKAFYSRQFWSILGYPADKFPPTIQPFKDLLHPDDRERVLTHISAYLNGETPEYNIILRMKHRDNSWIWIHARGRALYNKTGKAIRIVGAHTDITQMKVFEDKLHKAREFAENASHAKTDFLAHMSHEIRTPLTVISGIAEIFESIQDTLDERHRKLVKVLVSSTSALKELVNDILDFSKIESEEQEFELNEKPFSLQDVFEQIISSVTLKARAKNIAFGFDYQPVAGRECLGDPARFYQILLNLIGNALKFTDKGSITVTARPVVRIGQPFVQIDVQDTGIGINPEHFDPIFEMFKQGDSSVSRKYGGSGLGLPISLRLARLMGGDITVESIPGKGSTFTLLVPLKEQEAPKMDSKPAQITVADLKNILLVDDYEGNIVVLSHLLDNLQCSYDVARTGVEALNWWKEKHYDLILMDVQMPEMDGLTATALIRALEKESGHKRTPILGITAHVQLADREKCIAAGMDSYLPKPFVEKILKIKIIEMLDQQQVA